jgi:tRNA nucleotidyltransferase (CCA-adding enzyme)
MEGVLTVIEEITKAISALQSAQQTIDAVANSLHPVAEDTLNEHGARQRLFAFLVSVSSLARGTEIVLQGEILRLADMTTARQA